MESFYKNMPVLVTGGCGFIGSHLATKLVQMGAQVTIIDDLSGGSLENIEPIKDKVTLLHKSIVDKDACLDATRNQKIIFHLAAFISVPQSIEMPQTCHETNVDGTVNLLEAARKNGVKRFVFSSSAAVYGYAQGICSEEMPCNPESPYGFSKLIGELYCKQYAKNFGINAVIMRYFNVYGPRQNPNGAYAAVVAKFTNNLENNLPITIFGDGMQTRDFVPVESVANANLMLGMLAHKTSGQVFNIATGKSITLLELLDKLKHGYPDYKSAISFAQPRPGDIKYSQANCAKYFDVIKEIQ